MYDYRIKIYDPFSILIQWDTGIDIETNQLIHHLSSYLKSWSETEESVPAYNSLLWVGKTRIRNIDYIQTQIEEGIKQSLQIKKRMQLPILHIPVCYEEQFAPDLKEIKLYTGLNHSSIIEIHCGSLYHVYMVGFLPGFVFLGGLDKRLYIPRKKKPRSKVPVGAVGIGGKQTGIYPMKSPGGWNLIGRCPLPLFLPNEEPPFLIQPNRTVQFHAINFKEFTYLLGRENEFISSPEKLIKMIQK